MRRRFIQDSKTGAMREVPVSGYRPPAHRDTFGKQEIPHLVELSEKHRSEQKRKDKVERIKALRRSYEQLNA